MQFGVRATVLVMSENGVVQDLQVVAEEPQPVEVAAVGCFTVLLRTVMLLPVISMPGPRPQHLEARRPPRCWRSRDALHRDPPLR